MAPRPIPHLAATVTRMSVSSPAAQHAAAAVTTAFQRIHDEVFRGERLENEALEVEVAWADELEGPLGSQVVLILITPWALNGLVIPGRGLPESMDVAGVHRTLASLELPEIGSYTQVTLVGDVSRYTGQQQARTIALSMVPVLLAGLGVEA